MHKKRGQASTFMIIGVTALLLIILIFFLRDSLREKFRGAINEEEYLSSQLNQIRKNINSCVVKETEIAAKILGESGGHFNPEEYISYHGQKISTLCSNIKIEKKCSAKPIDISELNQRLSEHLKSKVKNCIDLGGYRKKDYKLSDEEFALSANIQEKSIIVEVDYPITLTLENKQAKMSQIINNVKIPLGAGVILANNIIGQEATYGKFDVITASLVSLGKYTIRERKSYPHKIYIIDFGNYVFNLGIEGET